RDKVRVLSPYVGGGFGSGLRPQYELPLAVLAARALKRSVRVTLTRQQMFTLGYRAANVHEMMLAADQDGNLASFRHEAVSMTSQFEDFQRDLVNWSSLLYRCANSELGQRLVKLDQNTPCDMRAPGGRKPPMPSNARWMSSPMRRTSIRSNCGWSTTRTMTRSRIDAIAAKSCANAIDRARKNSAGPVAIRSRVRCAMATNWSAGAWRPASGKRCRCRRAPRRRGPPMAASRSQARPPTSVPGPIRG